MSEELEQNMSEEIEQTNNEYSADSIQVLEGLEAVRMRPSMYIGDVNTKGLHHLVYEVVDNSIDEALAGYCKNIDVTINEDNSISVSDDGRGIPTGMNQKENRSALEVVMTILHAGGKFDKGSYKVSGGLHGVGVSCVNALSTKLVATIYREGKIWRQEYSKGFPLADVQVIGETDRTGTTIYFKPDDSIFYVTEYKYDILAARLRELAYLNRGIRLSLTDKRTIDPDTNEFKSEVFYSEKGLSEFVEYLDETREKLIDETIHITTEKNGIPIEVAMHYNTEFKENVYSYVNNINTIEGGTHLAGFRRGVMQTLKTYADNSGMLSKLKFDISGEDFREGLTAIISVKVAEPQFEGQTKTKLGNTEVGSAVAQAVSVALANYLEEHPKDARAIVDKVILAAQARHAARKARELVQRKTVLSGSGLPGKLADCSDNNPENCEIFLVEGDSAGGTAKQGRDRKFQAILPLRGKILNVEKALAHRVWESEEIKMIFQALGITIGTAEDSKAVNLEKIRYHKIVIMADADVDGQNFDIREQQLTTKERDFENALRPLNFEDFSGQDKVVDNLRIFVKAARLRAEALDHVLLHGPPGLGKTTLSNIIANELGVGFKVTSGPVLDKPGDLAGVLTSLEPNDVLFIDEIHRLSPVVEEYLYSAMEDYRIDIMIDKGPSARSIQLELSPFTLVGATTRSGLLTAPLRARFGINLHLEYYDDDVLTSIIRRSATILNVPCDVKAAGEIASRSRGTPRIANALLRRVRDFAQVKGSGRIDVEIARFALEALNIDRYGLDEIDNKILCTIIDKFKGGPVGLTTIATALGEDAGTIEEVYEPFLIKEGFLKRTPRGREVTELAYMHLGRSIYNSQKTLFDD